MRTLFLGLLIFLSWMFTSRWYYVCKIKNHCGYEQTVDNQEGDKRAKTLNLVDGDRNILTGYNQFKFATNATQPQLNDNNKEFIAKAVQYLKDHPNKNMTITGHHSPPIPKDGFGFFENIGLARANAIRQLFVQKGIAENRMSLDHHLLDEGEEISTPVFFKCYDTSTAANQNTEGDGQPDEFSNVGQAMSFTNMSFSDANFDYDSEVFKPGSAFKTYADSVKIYLSSTTDKSLFLTGHTCDKGSDSYNEKLGLARAKSVKKYFNNLGIKNNISTASDGEKRPAFRNDTEKSRSKNRRVVVQIK